MKKMKIHKIKELTDAVKASDYEKCSAMEIIRVFEEDISQLMASGAEVFSICFEGSFSELLPHIAELPKAEKMIVYTLQNPADFDEEELDRMTKCLDTLTAGRTAYGLKMTEDYPAQFLLFIRAE